MKKEQLTQLENFLKGFKSVSAQLERDAQRLYNLEEKERAEYSAVNDILWRRNTGATTYEQAHAQHLKTINEIQATRHNMKQTERAILHDVAHYLKNNINIDEMRGEKTREKIDDLLKKYICNACYISYYDSYYYINISKNYSALKLQYTETRYYSTETIDAPHDTPRLTGANIKSIKNKVLTKLQKIEQLQNEINVLTSGASLNYLDINTHDFKNKIDLI